MEISKFVCFRPYYLISHKISPWYYNRYICISLYNDTTTVLFCIDYFLKELNKYYLILSGHLKLLWTIFSISVRSPNAPKPHKDKMTHHFLMSSLIFSDNQSPKLSFGCAVFTFIYAEKFRDTHIYRVNITLSDRVLMNFWVSDVNLK